MRFSKVSAYLILGFVSNSLAWSDIFNNRIAEGKRRMDGIGSASQDTSRDCSVNDWDLQKNTRPLRGSAKEINDDKSLGLSSPIYSIRSSYPKGDGQKTGDFGCLYDPKGGAIIFQSLDVDKNSKPPISLSDVAWTVYKAACAEASTGSTNLRILMHTHVESADAENILTEVYDAADKATRDQGISITDMNSDQALAILGLDNGSSVSGLLQFHNQEMGGKSLKSVNIQITDVDWNIWWELQ